MSPGGALSKFPAAAAESAAEADKLPSKPTPRAALPRWLPCDARETRADRAAPGERGSWYFTALQREAHFAGGRQHGSSNYHLLLEGAKEFQSFADACWRDLQKHAATLLADAPRAKPASRAARRDDLLEDPRSRGPCRRRRRAAAACGRRAPAARRDGVPAPLAARALPKRFFDQKFIRRQIAKILIHGGEADSLVARPRGTKVRREVVLIRQIFNRRPPAGAALILFCGGTDSLVASDPVVLKHGERLCSYAFLIV